ncbi:MAG: hypothetical protein GY868_17350 [Deltaproteobacteria bacterium]|nr:hypothetical protein [Deltaproteobacteria bacterium]
MNRHGKSKAGTLMMVASLVLLLVPLGTIAASLDPTGPPDNATSAMHTLDDLYHRLDNGTTGTLRTGGFVEPTSVPNKKTVHTLNEIMRLMPQVGTNAASPEEVDCGKDFWGLRADGWGKLKGTRLKALQYIDVDGDGYGDVNDNAPIDDCPAPGYAPNNSDCNDSLAGVNPGAQEVCDNVDNDCNGETDGASICGTCYCEPIPYNEFSSWFGVITDLREYASILPANAYDCDVLDVGMDNTAMDIITKAQNYDDRIWDIHEYTYVRYSRDSDMYESWHRPYDSCGEGIMTKEVCESLPQILVWDNSGIPVVREWARWVCP